MKAVVRHAYGSPDVLTCEDVPKPRPSDGEVLVRVHAASVNPLDCHDLKGLPYFLRLGAGLFQPKRRTLGVDIAGTVEEVGRGVSELEPGDEVFGATRTGGFAEYTRARADRLERKPPRISFEQAAAVPVAGTSALQGLRDAGHLEPGQKVLINGASGGVGTFAVQIARALGAEVTGVCSTPNLQMVRSIGADHVIDYSREDCTRNGRHYDVILDCAAFRPVSDYLRVLGKRGNYVMVGGNVGRLFEVTLRAPWISWTTEKTARFMMARMNRGDLQALRGFIERGEVVPVVEKRYPLSETAAALRYVESGHTRGKVIVTMKAASSSYPEA